LETKVKELLGKPNKKMAELSIFSAFLMFAWLLLLFSGTIDLIGFLMTGRWHRLIFLGIIAVCITAICLIFKKGHTRGFSIADFVGLSIASLVVGGILALI